MTYIIEQICKGYILGTVIGLTIKNIIMSILYLFYY